MHCVAERQGFEPWEPEGSTVFETAPFDHSGTSPRGVVGLLKWRDNYAGWRRCARGKIWIARNRYLN